MQEPKSHFLLFPVQSSTPRPSTEPSVTEMSTTVVPEKKKKKRKRKRVKMNQGFFFYNNVHNNIENNVVLRSKDEKVFKGCGSYKFLDTLLKNIDTSGSNG